MQSRSSSDKRSPECQRIEKGQSTSPKTLTNTQRTPGIEYFDVFNNFASKSNLQQAFKSYFIFQLNFVGRGRKIHRTPLPNPRSKLEKSMINFDKSM